MDQEEGKQKRVRVLVGKIASLFIVLFDLVFFFLLLFFNRSLLEYNCFTILC